VIPPVAELKLLRSMQQLVADQTRAISEQETRDDSEVRSVVDLQRQLFEQGASLIERMNPNPNPTEPDTNQETPNPEPINPVEEGGATP